MHDTPVSTSSTARSRIRAGVVALGAAAGLTLAGLGVAAAQTEPTTPTTPTTPASPAEADAPHGRGGKGHAKHGKHGMGIHGEFTTRAPAGGYQTMAHQVGEVNEVSATSLTVKSEDGHTRSYVVNDETVVKAGDNGIGDVKQGDNVRVLAVVRDGKAFAVQVHDGTQVKARHDKWRPARPGAPAPAAGQNDQPAS